MAIPTALFLPNRVVAYDRAAKPRHYRLASDWFGRLRLEPQSDLIPLGANDAYWLVLDPQLVFFRQQTLTALPSLDLPRVAADFFPFSADQAFYAQTQIDGQDYVLAWRDQDWQHWQQAQAATPIAVLAAPNDSSAVLAAVTRRLTMGSGDLHPQPRKLWPPSLPRTMLWLFVLLTVVVGGFAVGQQILAWRNTQLQAELTALETEFGPIRNQGQALEKMQASLRAQDAFMATRDAALYAPLANLLQTLPPNHAIDRIEYKDGRLQISGLGQNAATWLAQNGVDANQVQIIPLPTLNRFTATIPIVPPPVQ